MAQRARHRGAAPRDREAQHRSWVVGQGGIDFAWAATALHTGELFRAAGLKPELTPDEFTFHLGLGPVRPVALRMSVADRDTGQRSALLVLETAPGSAVLAEERYEVTMDAVGRVVLTLDTTARPGRGVRAAAWPALRAALALVQRGYGDAMIAIVEGRPNRDR